MRGGRLDEHNKVSCLLFLVNEASNNKQFESILDAAAAYAKHIVGLVAPSPGWSRRGSTAGMRDPGSRTCCKSERTYRTPEFLTKSQEPPRRPTPTADIFFPSTASSALLWSRPGHVGV